MGTLDDYLETQDTMDESLRSVLVGEHISVFLGTGIKLHGKVKHVGEDYVVIKKDGCPKARIRIKAVVTWNYESDSDDKKRIGYIKNR